MRPLTRFAFALVGSLAGLVAIAYAFAGPTTALWMFLEGTLWIALFIVGERYLARKRRDEEREFVTGLEARIAEANRPLNGRSRDKN